jgi:predicted metal-dependent hydrolase
MSVMAALRYPDEYVQYLIHFHGDRDYFECHELLEHYWKKYPDHPMRLTWVGLIQAAVGMYHYRRGNVSGALKSIAGAIDKSYPEQLAQLGIDAHDWLERLRQVVAKLKLNPLAPYEDINIPLSDTEFEHYVHRVCEESGLVWGQSSVMKNPTLIHRHTLRDRSPVIEERRMAIQQRKIMKEWNLDVTES